METSSTVDYSEVVNRINKIYKSVSAEEQKILKTILTELAETGDSETYRSIWLADFKEIPVDKYTFLTDPYYLGNSNDCGASIYPAWMDTMLELERTGNQYYEIVFTGATRTGKTSTAVSDACYGLYWIMCLRDPQRYFSLKSVTTISVFFFNLTQPLARGVAFKEFNSTLSLSPWFLEHGTFSQSESNPVYIPEGGLIEIKYGSDASHAIGQATFIVVFDEVNFSQAGIKDVSKAKARMKEKYDTLVARVTGTFVKHGEVFGKLYVISSKKSDSDFMEEYIAAQKAAGNPHMYIFDKPQWEVWPASKYSSPNKFKVALGGRHLRSFVVPDDQNNPESLADIAKQGYTFIDVPEDNKVRFLADLDIALRDIAGISIPGTLAFITQESIDRCITTTRRNLFRSDILSIGTRDSQTIEEYCHIEEMPEMYKHMAHFIHLDLSLTTDRSGISDVCVCGRKDIELPTGNVISQPTFAHIFTVALEAPRGDKIPYAKITAFICWLRKKGLNIRGISRDQFQSEYMAQLLEAQGFVVDKLSLDRTADGYIGGRSIILEQRVEMVRVNLLENEMIRLQRDAITGKVDHLEGESKDASDSFMGALWNATLHNEGVAVPVKQVASIISDVNRPRYAQPSQFNMFPNIRKYM